MVEIVEHGRGIVRELVAQRADQCAGVHGCLQALAAYVSNYDQHRVVLEREYLKEIATDTVGGQIRALKHEVVIRRQLGGNEHGLNTACSFNLSGGALFVLADVDEAIEDHGQQAGKEDSIGRSADGKRDGAEVNVVKDESFGDPMLAGEVIENSVGRICRGRKEEGQQHDAGIRAAFAPGAEEQDCYEGAENNFRGDGKIFVDLLEMDQVKEGHQHYGNLDTAD